MTDFLPDSYNENKSLNEIGGGYMKFIKGPNRFRILEAPIVGWEWWEETEDGKKTPKRVKIDEKLDVSTIADPESIKRFWAMVVYNYETKKIQILEITQKGIQKTIEDLVKDEDWGSPVQTYDIVVTKTGDGMETKYDVLPKPQTKIDPKILESYKTLNINIKALYKGEDPYKESKEEEAEKVVDSIPF